MRFSILLAGSIFLCAIFVKPIAQDSFNSDQLVNLAFNGLETEKSNDQFLQDSANLGGFDNLTPTAKADETTDTDGIGSATPNQGETSIINSDYGGNSPPVSSNNEEYYISPAQPQDLADDPNKTPPTGSLDDGLLTGNSFHGHRPYFPLRNIYDSLHGFLQYFQLEPRPITPQKAICQGNRTPLCCYDGSDRWKNVYKQCYQYGLPNSVQKKQEMPGNAVQKGVTPCGSRYLQFCCQSYDPDSRKASWCEEGFYN